MSGKLLPRPPENGEQTKHKQQWREPLSAKKAACGSARGPAAASGGCFSFLKKGVEFKSSEFPISVKQGAFASPARYFYFTDAKFSNALKLSSFQSQNADNIAKIPHKSAGFLPASRLSTKFGTPDWIRTSGLQSRSLTRYPTAPRAHT